MKSAYMVITGDCDNIESLPVRNKGVITHIGASNEPESTFRPDESFPGRTLQRDRKGE
jgi:hypothetical protein